MTREDYAKDLIDQGLSEDDFILKMKEYEPDAETDIENDIDDDVEEVEETEVVEVGNDTDTDPPAESKYRYKGKTYTAEEINGKLKENETLEDYLKIHKDVYEIKPIKEVESKISFEEFQLKEEQEIVSNLRELYPGFTFEQATPGSDGIKATNISSGNNEIIELGTTYNSKKSGAYNDLLSDDLTPEEDALEKSKTAYDNFINFINDNPEKDDDSSFIKNKIGKISSGGVFDNIRLGEVIEAGVYQDGTYSKDTFKTENYQNAKPANKKEVVNLITDLDILQREAFNNPYIYDVGYEKGLGAESFTISDEDHDRIKESLFNKLQKESNLAIYPSSFNFLYEKLRESNKYKVEQDYKMKNILESNSVDLDPDFEKFVINSFDASLTPKQKEIQKLNFEEIELTKQLNYYNNKIEENKNKEESKEFNDERRSNQARILTRERDNVQRQYDAKLNQIKNAGTETEVINIGSMPGEPGAAKYLEIKTTNRELVGQFFNRYGMSQGTVDDLKQKSQNATNNLEPALTRVLQSQPKISQREAIGVLFNNQLKNLQEFSKKGNYSNITLKFNGDPKSWDFKYGSTMTWPKLKQAGLKPDKNGDLKISLFDLRRLGIDSEEFSGFFDEMVGMANDKDVDAIKMYNEEANEIETLAQTYRNLYAGNVDVGSIVKPGFWENLLKSTVKETYNMIVPDSKEGDAEDFVEGQRGGARARIDNINAAIDASTPELEKSAAGGGIKLTGVQEENIKQNVLEQASGGIGTFIPKLPLLAMGGGALNALGYAKWVKTLSPLGRLFIGSIVEEAKMQTILDMKPLGGTSFYTFGELTKNFIPFKKNFTYMQPMFNAVIKNGAVMTLASEVAGVAEPSFEAFMTGDAASFGNKFKELYNSEDGWDDEEQRYIVNAMTFGFFGGMHLKKTDLMTTGMKQRVSDKLQYKMDVITGKEQGVQKVDSDGRIIEQPSSKEKKYDELNEAEKAKYDQYAVDKFNVDNLINAEMHIKELTPPNIKLKETNPEKYNSEFEQFQTNFKEKYTDNWTKAIQLIDPSFEGVEVKFGSGEQFRNNNFSKENQKAKAQYDPETNIMAFDLSRWNPGVRVHEFGHVATGAYYKANPMAKRNFITKIDEIFKNTSFGETGGKELYDAIKEKYNINLSEQSTTGEMANEYLSFVGEYLSNPKVFYSSPDVANTLLKEISLEFRGIGVELGIKNNVPTNVNQLVRQIANIAQRSNKNQSVNNLVAGIYGNLNKVGDELEKINIRERLTEEGNVEAETAKEGYKFNEAKKAIASFDLSRKSTDEIVAENEKIEKGIFERAIDNPGKSLKELVTDEDRFNLYMNNQAKKYDLINSYERRSFGDIGVLKEKYGDVAYEGIMDYLDKQLYEYTGRWDPSEGGGSFGKYINQSRGFSSQLVNAFEKGGKIMVKNSEGKLEFLPDRLGGEAGELAMANLTEPTSSSLKQSGILGDVEAGLIDNKGEVVPTRLYKNVEKSSKELENAVIELDLAKEGIESYKTTLDKSNIAAEFGVGEKKVNNDNGSFKGKTSTRLSGKEVKSSQEFINQNARALYDNLPKNITDKGASEKIRGTSTGIQPNLLNAFYEQKGRINNKQGNVEQTKLPFNEAKFLEYFGIKDGVFETLKDNGKIDQRIKSLIHQQGKAITNYEIRRVKELTANQIEDLKSGKSDALPSKSLEGFMEELTYFENLGKKVDRKKLAKKYGLKDTDLKIGLIVDFKSANTILDWWNKAKEDIRVIEKTDSKIEKAAQEKAEKEIKFFKDNFPEVEKIFGFKKGKLDYKALGNRSVNLTYEDYAPRFIKSNKKILSLFPSLSSLPPDFKNYLEITLGKGKIKGSFSPEKYQKFDKNLKDFVDPNYMPVKEFNDVFGGEKTLLEVEDWMYDVWQPNYNESGLKKNWSKALAEAKEEFPNWETSDKLAYKQYLTSRGRQLLSNPKLVDANGKMLPDAYERTMTANRKAISLLYNNLAKNYLENPTKETIENIFTFLQMQTNSQESILKGLVPMEYLSLREASAIDNPTGTKFHNEHMKELSNANMGFLRILAKYKNNPEKLEIEINKHVSDFSQALTTKQNQKLKDAKGGGFQFSKNKDINTFVSKNEAANTIILSGDYQASTVADMIINEKGIEIAKQSINKIPDNELSSNGVEVKRILNNIKETNEVVTNNLEVINEAGLTTRPKDVTQVSNNLGKDKGKTLNVKGTIEPLRIIDKANSNNRIPLDKVKAKPIEVIDLDRFPTKIPLRVIDADDVLLYSNSKVYASNGVKVKLNKKGQPTSKTKKLIKEGKIKVLNAAEFAKSGEKLKDQGWEMNFEDFDRVVDGTPGPLLEAAKKMINKRGGDNVYVLTARSPKSQRPLFKWLKSKGANFKEKNVVGLGNSSGQAKADWMVKKYSEGFNEISFFDDAIGNIDAAKAAFNAYDLNGTAQLVKKPKASLDLSEEFNKNLEESSGIGREKVYSPVKAKLVGATKKRQRFFIPSSAEDFTGLLYTTLGKGKEGEAHMAFYQKNLLDPYNRATENLSQDRVNLFADFKALKEQLQVPKDLKLKTESGFTNEQAIRTYLWGQTGKEIPGLSKTDFAELNKVIENNPKLQAFADQILEVTKGDGYSDPGRDWAVGTITTDLMDLLQTTKRAKYLQEFETNKDAIFSPDNLNKLEAAYGPKYREALENSLSRMKNGSNRTPGGNKLTNNVLNYINQSTAVTMFANTRSALLQTISAANYINQSFNNPLKAGKAFANQPQYWKDYSKLINSDYLVDRRNGLKMNISESEIANAAKTSKNKAKAVLNYMLEKGYAPTKYADSFAIASGGALFYRNRINDLMKNGIVDSPTDPRKYTLKEAESQALKEWRANSEMSQQSSDPSKISQQQSSDIGRVILQYVNTPMQYARVQKRDVQDMVNKRAMPGKTLAESNRIRIGRVAYYGFLQNMIFNTLQQGTFSLLAGDNEDLTEKQEKKLVKTANGMLDSSLRGLGMAGVSVQVIKNLGIDIYDRTKKSRPEYSDAYKQLLNFSPAIKRKLSGIEQAGYPFNSKKAREKVFNMGPYNPANPAYESMAKVVSATTNVPLDRMYRKIENLKDATADDNEAWESVAMFLGWPKWQIKDEQEEEKSNNSFKLKGGVKLKGGIKLKKGIKLK